MVAPFKSFVRGLYRELDLATSTRVQAAARVVVQVGVQRHRHRVGGVEVGGCFVLLVSANIAPLLRFNKRQLRPCRAYIHAAGVHLGVVQKPRQTGKDDDDGSHNEQPAYHETLPEILQRLSVLVGGGAILFCRFFADFLPDMLALARHVRALPRRAAFLPLVARVARRFSSLNRLRCSLASKRLSLLRTPL